MAIKITKSHDISGVPAAPQSGIASATAVATLNVGGSERDLLINYNAQIGYERNRSYGNTGFVIDTNFDIKNGTAAYYSLAGLMKTINANTNFDTGTAATITATKWGIAILTYDGSTGTVTWAKTATVMAYASEALAKAALGTMTSLCAQSGFATLGYVTVQAGAALWTAGTDALTTGTGGTVATSTNYYDDPTLNGTNGGWQIGNRSGTVITQ